MKSPLQFQLCPPVLELVIVGSLHPGIPVSWAPGSNTKQVNTSGAWFDQACDPEEWEPEDAGTGSHDWSTPLQVVVKVAIADWLQG